MPALKTRNVLTLAWVGQAIKALEAVKQISGDTTNLYYQVVWDGREVFQSIDRSEAQRYYDALSGGPLSLV